MSQFQNWIAGIPMSIPPRVELFPLAVENLAKGRVCVTNTAGFVTIAAAADVDKPYHVSIEAKDNSGGSAGDLKVSVVTGPGQQVTVQTKEILEPGDPVKISGTDGMVALFAVGSDDNNLKVGIYIGKEPGIYVKDVATPFAESFVDDFTSVNAAVDDIVIIELTE